MKLLLTNLYIYGMTILWSVLFCLVAVIPLLLAAPFRGLFPRFMRGLILCYGWGVVRLAWFPVVRVRYTDLAPEEREPGIVVFNHRSGSDAFLAAVLGREVVQAVNGWPMRLPFFGFFARLGGYIDITQQSYEETRDRIAELIAQGVTVIAFPEGTRSGSREIGQFRSGVFRAALELDIPVYPGAISGNERIPDKRFRFSPGVIRIHKLPLLRPSAPEFSTAFSFKQTVRERIIEETARMDHSGFTKL